MKSNRTVLLTVCLLAFAGCAAMPPAPMPMELCKVTEETAALDPGQMRMALIRAQEYSNDFYGEDCFVCAELMSHQDGEIKLHITSPLPDMLINTSAAITVRAADGKVLDKGAYHSCRAKITPR